MVARADNLHTMTVEQWRELERGSHDVRHEYIDGHVYGMAGGSANHARISINVVRALDDALEGSPCRAYNSDMAARLSARRYTYPDASVTCDERDRGGVTEIQSPRLIVEVLSDSTEAYDRGQKFAFYRVARAVQEYVLVATRYQAVEVYRRTSRGWTDYHSYGVGDLVSLESIGAGIPVSALYRFTDVPDAPDDPEGEL